MSSTKSIKTRIQNKHAVEADWIQAKNFIPLEGEVVIYDPDTTNKLPRVKIGDGKSFINDLPFVTDGHLPAEFDAKDNSYHISKPLKVKTDNANSYFINTEGEASLAIIGYADANNDSEARLVLGNKNKANFAIRDQVMNSKDAVLNIWDYNYDNGHTLLRLEPVNAFKQKAFNDKKNHSGAYVQSVVWPGDKESVADYHQLDMRLSRILHEDNIQEYAATRDELVNVTDKVNALTSGSLSREIKNSLPSKASAKENIIYMIGPNADNTYDEYMYVASKNDYELIGNTRVDLSGYLPLSGGVLSGDIQIGASGEPQYAILDTNNLQFWNSAAEHANYSIDSMEMSASDEDQIRIFPSGLSLGNNTLANWQEELQIDPTLKSTFDGSHALGSMTNKTIAQLQSALDTWLNTVGSVVNASANFYAETGFVDKWNSGDTTKTINAGVRWIVTIVASYNDGSYTQLRFSTYSDKQVYYVCKKNGAWSNVRHVAFTDETATKTELQTVKGSLSNYIPKTNSGGMYVIDTPLNVKTNSKDNYFINKSGDSSLNIRSDVANGTASLNLGQNSKSKYGLRVRQNTDDLTEPPRFDIYDYVGNKSIAIYKSVEEIKMDAFQEYQESGSKDVNSGLYIGTAVWPEGTTPTSASQLDYQLAKVIHARNIGDYAVLKENQVSIQINTWEAAD